MEIFRHIKDLLKQNIWRYALGVLLLIVIDAFQLVPPWIIGRIVDKLVAKDLPNDFLLLMVVTILALELVIAVCRYFWRVLITGGSREIETAIRQRFFGHLEKLSLDYYINNKTGDLMARATNDLNSVRMAFGPGVIMITDAIFLTLTTVTIMATQIDARLTFYALIPLPILAVIIAVLGPLIQRRHKKVSEAFSTISERAREAFTGIRIIKTFVRERAIVDEFNKDNHQMLKRNLQLVSVWGFMFPMIGFIASTSVVLAIYFGGQTVLSGHITIGEFVTFVTYLGLLTWPFMAIGWVINVLQRGVASLKRINDILDAKPDINDDESNEEVTRLFGDIELKDLSFTYPNDAIPMLKHLSFKVKRGQTLAILGRTGSGKTTLANLLIRLYNAPRGTLFIDGHDIRNIPLKLLRDHIGYVPQNNFLFSQSIKENIAITDDDTKLKKVTHYAKLANIGAEIESLPNGYDTMLGERGVNLSGGQKQRISIARSLIKNPDLVILDDALSAVDTKTEESILTHLKSELKDKTAIIIAHRISSIKHADQIIVLDNGYLSQIGTHDELLSQDGFYRELFEKQQLEERIASYDA
ncbi:MULTISPECIES: ABC transporter ATP-binding protein [unclassified Fusibacter]|uniref:ABC transporter ATP-binding protein n=1 Tax=unclassified Fusibacter TaxID=2624464 RepID=UPI001011F161|nr:MULTISPECIES: ABC transporter ATP-binding protein [unclassified Fusibacter]MCK8061347.1 ABC transporter ATP-binding protein/permease [Fusibacter sp. A2]NPE23610.1 ABC transporter ATP-binding protein [Fusibacter sp. A1]RXV59018.1 ABC transporter ATP-binding protein [Fusibacter sp. A1]